MVDEVQVVALWPARACGQRSEQTHEPATKAASAQSFANHAASELVQASLFATVSTATTPMTITRRPHGKGTLTDDMQRGQLCGLSSRSARKVAWQTGATGYGMLG